MRPPPSAALWLLLLALPAPPAARAGEPATDEPVSVVGPVLRRAPLVVRGTLEGVKALGIGVEMATLRVEDTLRGRAPAEGRAVLLSNEEGYLRRHAGDGVFFLSRLEGRDRYEAAAVVGLEGRDGPARLAALRRVLEVEALPAGERTAALRRVCYEGLGAADAWTRRNAGRELLHLVGIRPGGFTPRDAEDVRRRAAAESDAVLRPLLVEAATGLARAARAGRLAPESAGERVSLRGAALLRRLREAAEPQERAGLLRAVAAEPGEEAGAALEGALAGDPDPSVRAAAAAALASRGGAAAPPVLLRRLGEEKDGTARVALVEALGSLRTEAAVPPLAALAGRRTDLAEGCLFALARVRSPEALSSLRSLRADYALAGDARGDGLRDLVDFLLSEDFLKQEEALRRLRER